MRERVRGPMYRVSREGRRASSNNHGPDTPPRGSYKDRFANSASSAYHSKTFSAPPLNRPSYRNPKVQIYLKIAAVVGSLFFLRRVRSAEQRYPVLECEVLI